MPIIDATNPLVVPATEEVAYDKWVIYELNLKPFSRTQTNAFVTLQRARVVGGDVEYATGPNSMKSILIENLEAKGIDFPAVPAALTALATAIVEYGSANNLL